MLPCPRRAETGLTIGNPADDHFRDDDTCSYCGSLNPVVLLTHMAAGTVKLGPTDKNYKVYADIPEAKPNKMEARETANFIPGGDWETAKANGWRKAGTISRAVYGLGEYTVAFKLSARGPIRHAKFYFQHFSEEQKDQFIQMLNDKTCEIGYPGHFYRLPFFIQRKPTDDIPDV